MKNIIQPLKTIVLALVIGLGISYAMAWTAPTAPPPNENVPAPVNVGPSGGTLGSMQYKSDGLAIGGMFQTDSDTYLAVQGGRVGIGTDNPTAKLDVNGGMSVNAGTSGFLTVKGGSASFPLTTNCSIDPLANDPLIQVENTGYAYYKVENGVSYTKATGLVAGGTTPSSCDSGWVVGTSASCSFSSVLSLTTLQSGPSYNYTVTANFTAPNNTLSVGATYTDSNESTSCSNGAVLSYPDVYSVDSAGGVDMAGDLRLGGSNSWILHTPDDGRADLFIAPKKNGLWDWASQIKIDNNGNMTTNDVTVNGKLLMNGDIKMKGNIDLNYNNINQAGSISSGDSVSAVSMHIDSTNKGSWPSCDSGSSGQIRFDGSLFYGCMYVSSADDSGTYYWTWRALAK